MKNFSVASIIIPSYNGAHILSETLPSLCELIEKECPGTEIIIVDDASSDNTVSILKKKISYQLKIIKNKKRGGFQKTCNKGAEFAKHDLLFFLNNDMQVDKTLLPPLINHFNRDDNLFAVSASSIVNHHGNLMDEIPAIKRWENGFLFIDQFLENPPINLSHASGGCMCVRKDRFFELNGFDELFYPAYFEDVDLCWRAIKKRWRIIHEPKVRLFHKSHATLNSIYDEKISSALYWKNYFLFIWKNISDKKLIKDHADHFFYNLAKYSNTTSIIPGFKMALTFIDKIQNNKINSCNLTDEKLLNFKGVK